MVAHADHRRTVVFFMMPRAAGRRVSGPLRRLGDDRVPPARRGCGLVAAGAPLIWRPGRTLRGPARRRRRSAVRRDLWGRSPRGCAPLARLFLGKIGEAFAGEPIDLAGDQPLDFGDVFLIGGGDDRKRDTGFASAAGAANPVDIILGMASEHRS